MHRESEKVCVFFILKIKLGWYPYGGLLSTAAFREMPCHIWLVDRMKFASLETNLGEGWGLLVYPNLPFCLPLSGRSPDITEMLLTGSLSLNSINEK